MSNATQNYQHLLGKNADEAVEILKNNGMFFERVNSFSPNNSAVRYGTTDFLRYRSDRASESKYDSVAS